MNRPLLQPLRLVSLLIPVALAACQPSSAGAPKPVTDAVSSSAALSTPMDVATVCETLPPSNSIFLYVSLANGNDATAILGDRTRPWKTFAAALAKIPATLPKPYAIEVIDSSTYTEAITVSGKTTTATNALYLRTAAGVTPVFTGGTTSVPLTVSTSFTTVEGFTLQAGTTVNGLVLSAATTGNSILCNSFEGNAAGLISTAGAQASLTLEGNRFENNATQAVSLKTGSTGLMFRRNVVVNNGTGTGPSPAVDLASATSPSIINNTFYGNNSSATATTSSADLNVATTTALLLKNNIFANTTSNASKRSIRLDAAAGTIAAGSNYNSYYYPKVCTGFTDCPSCGDAFSVGGSCTCYLANGGACGGGVNSWQTQLNADKLGSTQGVDPLFVAPTSTPPDLHEKSTGGHYVSPTSFATDASDSPAVDTGDPADAVGAETQPNGPASGPRINKGAYGGGPQASRTSGTRVVLHSAIGKAGTALTVTIDVENTLGTVQTNNVTYTANLTFPNNPNATGPASFTIPANTGSITVAINDTVAEDVVPKITQTTGTSYVTNVGTLTFEPLALAEPSLIAAVSGNTINTVLWNNPATHDGVLILRSTGGPPTTRPSNQTQYAVGQSIGNATVIYNDTLSYAQRMVDQGLTNGTKYYYRVFNHDKYFTYSAGSIPTPNGVFATATTRVTPSPDYCYSVGVSFGAQPTTEPNVGVYSAGNNQWVSGNQTLTADAVNDGQERWRPFKTQGAVQSRSPVVPLMAFSGNTLIVGDQSGYVYALDPSTGTLRWPSAVGPLVGGIQAQVSVQLNAYSDANFQGKIVGDDLLFVATSTGAPTNNVVYALNGKDGSVRWTYPSAKYPASLDIISGGMLVDYGNDRLWVASRSNGGAQASLTVLDTTSGAPVTSYKLGDIDLPVNEDFTSKQAYVTTRAGTVLGFDLNPTNWAQAQKFSVSPGAMSSYPFPTGNGFIASLNSGGLQWYKVDPSTGNVSTVWSSPIPISGPSGIRIQYTSPQKIFVGSSDGKIHQIDVASATDEKQVVVSTATPPTGGVGTPTLDTKANRLEAGSLDGQMCVFQLPL